MDATGLQTPLFCLTVTFPPPPHLEEQIGMGRNGSTSTFRKSRCIPPKPTIFVDFSGKSHLTNPWFFIGLGVGVSWHLGLFSLPYNGPGTPPSRKTSSRTPRGERRLKRYVFWGPNNYRTPRKIRGWIFCFIRFVSGQMEYPPWN